MAEGEIWYRFGLEDEYSPGVAAARAETEAFTAAGERASIQVDLFGQRVREAGTGATEAFSAFRNLGGILVSLSVQSFVLNLIWRRLEHAQLTLIEATERHREALEELGPAHEKTIAAARRMELAQKDLTRAQQEQAIYTVITIGQMGVLGARIIETAGKFGVLNVATWAQVPATISAAAADVWHTIVLHKKAIALAMATAGVSIAIGLLALYAMNARMAATETSNLTEKIGERPSTGLVKSLEDLHFVLSPPSYRFETSITVAPDRLEEELNRFTRNILSEVRRISA